MRRIMRGLRAAIAGARLRMLPGGRIVLALAAAANDESRRAAVVAAARREPRLIAPLARLARARRFTPAAASHLVRALAADAQAHAAERIAAAALDAIPGDASLRRDRLRLLAGLGNAAAAARYGRDLLGSDDLDCGTAFLLWTIADAAEGKGVPLAAGLATEAAQRAWATAADDSEGWLVRARIARHRGDHQAALGHARQAIAADASTDFEARRARAEAIDFVFEAGLWPGAMDLLEAAIAAGTIDPSAPRIAAARAIAARNPLPLAPMPQLAVDDLVHNILPRTRPGPRDGPILMVAGGLGSGGMERVLAATIAGLAGRGNDVRLALASFDAGDPASVFHLAESGLGAQPLLHLRGFPAEDPSIAALPQRWRDEAAAVRAHVQALRPRVVHAWNDRRGLVAALGALAAGCPRLVIHLHHMRPLRHSSEAIGAAHYPQVFRRLAERDEVRFAFCAEAAARDYADWTGLAIERFEVIRNGFAIACPPTLDSRAAARARFALPGAAPVIASLFRFENVKQPLLWVDAAARIAAALPDACFLMPGDGPLLPAVRARAQALGIADRVRTPGRINDIDAALAAADLMMMSSASEGLPNGAVEAQLAGVPLVALDVGGTRETIIPGVTGSLVTANDTAALADAALGWLRDPAARAAAGDAARAHAIRAFSMERYLDDLERLYAGAPQ